MLLQEAPGIRISDGVNVKNAFLFTGCDSHDFCRGISAFLSLGSRHTVVLNDDFYFKAAYIHESQREMWDISVKNKCSPQIPYTDLITY